MARAWAPTVRALPLPTLGAVLALAATPSAIVLAQGGRDLSNGLVAAALLGAAVTALVVDDPAGETLAASPTSLARRRLLRGSALLLAVAACWAALIALGALVGEVTGAALAERAAEAAAVSGIAVAAAGAAWRRGAPAAVQSGGLAGPLSVLLVSALAQRFSGLPAVASPVHHDRWWALAGVAWAVALWSSRDPAR